MDIAKFGFWGVRVLLPVNNIPPLPFPVILTPFTYKLPVISTLPVMVCEPLKIFEPVVANELESNDIEPLK